MYKPRKKKCPFSDVTNGTVLFGEYESNAIAQFVKAHIARWYQLSTALKRFVATVQGYFRVCRISAISIQLSHFFLPFRTRIKVLVLSNQWYNLYANPFWREHETKREAVALSGVEGGVGGLTRREHQGTSGRAHFLILGVVHQRFSFVSIRLFQRFCFVVSV